ncbi:hypothetical protein M427DRAFT_60669 [Gonapodya prolifera JEL478]|uniref:DUF4345 domain-containing protein n=1 Tax=Gonapodya prolifera (strain JEL478) TaxID=1344416 RepID=A0A139A3S0_GONPJ|nr:hypothetical protein M427DRAFT_60669 [Gonapodya prolifera JEL478]|eukprot:KXS11430.1 hypothetical protein M427DRAFT_60669 [Gonapodya prolifera JEL478]
MEFQVASLVMTCAGTALGLRFIFAGEGLLEEWDVKPSPGSLVISRRIGAIYLGLALTFFLERNAPPSELRSAICLGTAAISAFLAACGLVEYGARRVGPGIFRSVIAEVVGAAGFIWVWSRA